MSKYFGTATVIPTLLVLLSVRILAVARTGYIGAGPGNKFTVMEINALVNIAVRNHPCGTATASGNGRSESVPVHTRPWMQSLPPSW